jgi:hypothetical protein
MKKTIVEIEKCRETLNRLSTHHRRPEDCVMARFQLVPLLWTLPLAIALGSV